MSFCSLMPGICQTAATTMAAVVLGAILAAYLLYRAALPKPLHGIPYNSASSRRLLGDIPAMLSHIKNDDGTFITYIEETLQRLNAPLVQVFIKPMGKPLLVLADFREAQDIMTRRTKEFDRSTSSGDLVRGLGSSHHIHLKTTPAWRLQRRLVQDLMTPSFLHRVAGPVIHQYAGLMVDLWRVKSRIAAGRPWAASEDIDHVALDAVLVFAFGGHFGRRHSSTRRALEALGGGGISRADVCGSQDEPIIFDAGHADEVVRASLELTASVEEVQGSPLPDLHWAYVNSKPRIRRATKIKEDYIRIEVEDAVRRLNKSNDEQFVRSAVDHMVFRESALAARERRKPDFFSRVMIDEIFGFIIAGNDTSSTSISWGLKYLADNPEAQGRLRRALEAGFGVAMKSCRNPTIQEITEIHVPYLDAVVEETLRCSATVPVVDRQALVDTELLGHTIPKGSVVTCLVSGPSMMSPPFNIDPARRGQPEADAKEGHVKAWDCEGMACFRPERWLDGQKDGFDPGAGPQLAFGLGPRQCFGKRLAHLEMRIVLGLIVWNFELLPCPPELSGSKPVLIMTNRPRDCYVRLREVARRI